MAAMALFMAVYGAKLVEATWHNTIADFPFLSVGVTYLPIPIGGAILLLFVIERILIGPPPDPLEIQGGHGAPPRSIDLRAARRTRRWISPFSSS